MGLVSSRMKYVHRGLWLGGAVLGVGFLMYGWGQEESSRSRQKSESRPAVQRKTAPQTKGQARLFEQTRPGRHPGTGGVIDSLLPAPSPEESWLEGRSPGPLSLTGQVGPTESLGFEENGRSAKDVEASAELRRKIVEELAEEQRLERDQTLARELALGDRDQDYDGPDFGLPEQGPQPGYGKDDALRERAPERIESGIDAQGRDVEEVEALADLRQELAADFAEEQEPENLKHEQAFANEFALGDSDQDSGEDPGSVRQAANPLTEFEPAESGGGAVSDDGDGD